MYHEETSKVALPDVCDIVVDQLVDGDRYFVFVIKIELQTRTRLYDYGYFLSSRKQSAHPVCTPEIGCKRQDKGISKIPSQDRNLRCGGRDVAIAIFDCR